MSKKKVRDLRSALELLQSIDGQLVETDVEVDPLGELSGVYRHVGAGGTVMRPTQEGESGLKIRARWILRFFLLFGKLRSLISCMHFSLL